jgi:hypothetical protein
MECFRSGSSNAVIIDLNDHDGGEMDICHFLVIKELSFDG